MLETLADNRDLQANLDEAKQMLTQVDVTRFSTYRWGVEAGLNQAKAEYEQSLAEKEAALEEKESALAEQRELLRAKDAVIQEEKQRITRAVKQLITFNTLSYQAIAELMNIPVEEVEAVVKEVGKH